MWTTQAVEQARERLAVEIFHGHRQSAVVAKDLVRLHDVGMAEPRTEAGLGEEQLDGRGIIRQLRPEALENGELGDSARSRRSEEVLGHFSATDPRDRFKACPTLRFD